MSVAALVLRVMALVAVDLLVLVLELAVDLAFITAVGFLVVWGWAQRRRRPKVLGRARGLLEVLDDGWRRRDELAHLSVKHRERALEILDALGRGERR